MKHIVCMLLLFAFWGTSSAQSSKKETITIKTAIHCDHCMQCESCSLNINKAVKSTEGVSKVKINPSEHTITVTFKPSETTPDAIRQSIANAGYDADDVKATTVGYEKLDGCCKIKKD